MKTKTDTWRPAGPSHLDSKTTAGVYSHGHAGLMKLFAALVLLWLCAGLSTSSAVNLLTNPGFEEGQTGWANPNTVYGSPSVVITNAGLAHSGNNCISNYNSTGISGPAQGDVSGGWSSGVSLPVSDGNFYKLSAYVKVPGASTNAQAITLRYRFEPSTTRNDVGTKTINTENWTFLESGWLQPAPGDYFMSYWSAHSLNTGVLFYADDCSLEESVPLTLQGRVITNGVGVDGANVVANSTGYSTAVTTTAGGGYYSFTVPPGTYTVGANTPGFLGSTNVVVASSPTTASDIILNTDPDYDPNLLLFARSSAFTAGYPWPTAFPAGGALGLIGSPGVKSLGGVQWEQNVADGPGFLLGTYNDAIPVNGASVVVVARPKRMPSNNWDSIVDVFHNRLVLGIRNDTGLINVYRNGELAFSPAAIPENQTTVLSLVVQPTGEYKVWANGVQVMTNTGTSDMTSLVPFVPGSFANGISLGRNKNDGWSTFNGNIGDVYIYKTALDDTQRQALEASLMNKFITNATLSYTITASAGANGVINPSGTTTLLQGYDQTYTMTGNSGYVVSDVLVDGVSVGAVTSYTFSNVSTNHTISASFVALPPQPITASAGANGTISPSGTVYVAAGNNQTFSIIPNSGYAVSSVIVDGVSQGEIYSYTFNFVTAPHTISATFRALSMNIPKVDQLVFGAVSSVLPGDSVTITNWPAYVPTNKTLVTIGSPTSTLVGTNIWESNNSGTFDGYRYPGGSGGGGEYLAPIPCSGATIIAVAAPTTLYSTADGWNSIVDVFYDQLVLGIRNYDGTVVARIKGSTVYSSAVIPSGQPTVLTMVVQPDGSYKVWANAALVLSGSSSSLTNLTPGADAFKHYINVGRNNPDGWTSFNGNIGDVFLYKTALSTAERQQVESILMTKFGAPLPPKYAWNGPNNGNWSDIANWNNNVPGIGNTAVFSDTNTAGATVQLDTAVTVNGVEFNNLVPNTTIASSLGNTLTLDNGTTTALAALIADAGSHTISAAVDAPVGINKSGAGKLTLSGTVTLASTATVNPVLVVSETGSELEVAGTTTVGFTKGLSVKQGGKLTVTGALITQDSDQLIGTGAGQAYMVLKGTGSWTHTGSGNLQIANDAAGCVGTLTIQDSAVLDTTAGITLAVGWGGACTATVNQTGGTVIDRSMAGTGMGWNNSPGCVATYHLDGGVLETRQVWGDGLGNNVFSFNGGTLRAEDETYTNQFVIGLTHAYVQDNGAIIDNNGFNVGLSQALEHGTGAAIDGGLRVQGSGTLTLSQPSTYTGTTKVLAGVLAFKASNALAATPLEIDSAASVNLVYAGTRSIPSLKIGGSTMAYGVYGAIGSGAQFENSHITGTGTITVAAPQPPAPVLSGSSLSMSGGVPSFTFGTVAGYKYRLVYKNALTDPTWQPVIYAPNYPAPDGWGAVSTGAAANITDSAATGQPKRFYRVEAANP